MKQTGYKTKEYGVPTKRYCQTLDLKDDPGLIAEYRKRHTENEASTAITPPPSFSTLTLLPCCNLPAALYKKSTPI